MNCPGNQHPSYWEHTLDSIVCAGVRVGVQVSEDKHFFIFQCFVPTPSQQLGKNKKLCPQKVYSTTRECTHRKESFLQGRRGCFGSEGQFVDMQVSIHKKMGEA